MSRLIAIFAVLMVLAAAAVIVFQLSRDAAPPPTSDVANAPADDPKVDADSASKSLPVAGIVPPFRLVDQSGQVFGREDLSGKITLVNFMFTRCEEACSAQTTALRELQSLLVSRPDGDNVRLLSISVDPEFDTPAVLSEYAAKRAANLETWSFLTGPRDEIAKLCQSGFSLPATNQTGPILSSSPVFVVDRHGRIRSAHKTADPEERGKVLANVDRIRGERKAVPEEILDPPWLDERMAAQLATIPDFEVFHDFQFTDLRPESGITFHHKIVDDAGREYQATHYDHGNGVAVADVDGDGLLDLYFVNQVGPNGLWRNSGDGRFEEITEAAGVAVSDAVGVTASFADIDNDGDADLFVTTVRGGNRLFLNDGSGAFADVSAEAGLDHHGHSSGAVFFDYDRDGLLDLFVTNVGKYTSDDVAQVTMETSLGEPEGDYQYFTAFKDAFAGHLKPEERNERSLLYHNEGDHHFVDVTEQIGLQDVSWTGDAIPLDRNSDGWPDLYVLNMQGNDEYYENEAGKRFVNRSRDYFPKTPWGAMGAQSFDYDNDGDFDLFITDMHSDMVAQVGPKQEKLKNEAHFPDSFLRTTGTSIFGNAFYDNQGDGTFVETSDEIGGENYWPWGLSVGDLNADGFEDVFIASSMNLPFRYGVNSVLLNNRGKRFLDSEFILGVEPRRDRVTAIPYFECDCDGADKEHIDCKDRDGRVVVWSAIGSRSSVIFDLDEDGDLDIVTNDFNSPPMVLVSNLAEQRSVNFLKIELIGSASNRDGLGAVVKVVTPSMTLTQSHDGQSGYLSQSRMPLYFGLGDETAVERVEVVWPSGTEQVLEPPFDINTRLEIQEPPRS